MSERRHGKKPSYVIPLWNGILEHCQYMGIAVWEFIWCLDKITVEDEQHIGWCLGKKPIDIEIIARDLGEHRNTALANVAHLESEGYIIRKRTPRGYSIGVRNSRKFGVFGRKSDTQTTVHHSKSDTQEKVRVIHNFQESDTQETAYAKHLTLQLTQQEDIAVPQQTAGDVTIPLPSWIPSHEWFAFIRSLKQKPDEHRQELFVKKLSQLRDDGHDPAAVLEQSIMSGWQGLFPIRAALKKPDPNDRSRNNARALGLCEYCFHTIETCRCISGMNHRNSGMRKIN